MKPQSYVCKLKKKNTQKILKIQTKCKECKRQKRFYDRNKKLVNFYLNFIQRDHNINCFAITTNQQ